MLRIVYHASGFLLMATLVLLVVGMISPKVVIRWGAKQTRGRVLLFSLGALILFASVLSMTEPPEIAKERIREGKIAAQQEKERQERDAEEARMRAAKQAAARAEQAIKDEAVKKNRARKNLEIEFKNAESKLSDLRQYKNDVLVAFKESDVCGDIVNSS